MTDELLTEIQKNNRLLMAVLTLQARSLDIDDKRPELTLADAGLTYQEVATVLNKKPDAVRMMLARNKSSKNPKSPKNI